MKVNKKVLRIIAISIGIILVISTTSFGTHTPIDFFKDNINTHSIGTENAEALGERILGIIQVVGTIIAVGALMILGIKYMMGSAEEKAEYKKTLLPYFIGAILLFAASNLAQIIYNWANKL